MTTTTDRHGFIVEDGGDYIQVKLPDWLTPDQRRRIKSELDDIFQGSRAPESVSTASWLSSKTRRRGRASSSASPTRPRSTS